MDQELSTILSTGDSEMVRDRLLSMWKKDSQSIIDYPYLMSLALQKEFDEIRKELTSIDDLVAGTDKPVVSLKCMEDLKVILKDTKSDEFYHEEINLIACVIDKLYNQYREPCELKESKEELKNKIEELFGQVKDLRERIYILCDARTKKDMEDIVVGKMRKLVEDEADWTEIGRMILFWTDIINS